MPPFKILERYWLEGRLRRPSSSDLGMHLLSNLGRSLLAMATKSTKLTPTGVRHWPASTLASPTAHREHRQIYLRVNAGNGHQKHKTHSDWSQALASEHPGLPDCSPGASANLPARDLPKFNKRYLVDCQKTARA